MRGTTTLTCSSVPELPEMEIVARRLARGAARARRSSRCSTPGINALKTFDPPLSALEGATFTDVRRRGKLLLLEARRDSHGPLTLLVHLMTRRAADALRQARLAARQDLARADPAARATASCGCASSAPSRRRG